MKTARDRLLALRAEAHRQHDHFETRKYNRKICSKVLNAAIALGALATAASSMVETPGETTICLAIALLIATIVNLAVTDTERDRDLHGLSGAWRRHRTDAAQLLARDAVQRAGDTPDRIRDETAELECRITETRSDSLIYGPGPELPAAPTARQDAAAAPAPGKR